MSPHVINAIVKLGEGHLTVQARQCLIQAASLRVDFERFCEHTVDLFHLRGGQLNLEFLLILAALCFGVC